VRDLQCTSTEFLKVWNASTMPLVWTAGVERILEKIAARAKDSNGSSHAAYDPSATHEPE